jgi:hypothetical protein
VGLGLAAVSDVRASPRRTNRDKWETYHDIGSLDSTLSDVRGNKLRHSPLSKMDVETANQPLSSPFVELVGGLWTHSAGAGSVISLTDDIVV